MTPAFDMEALHIAVIQLQDALNTMLTHKVHTSIRWRINHLLRELAEFRLMIWRE